MPEQILHTMMRGLGQRVDHRGEVVVVGLGRFGSALATELVEMGTEVLGIDIDPVPVREHTDVLTQVVEADGTDLRALRQLGVAEAVTAVVAIGSDVEASILATAALVDVGIPNIWARAATATHGRILERVGAHNVVYPGVEVGQRVAHLITGGFHEYLALADDFVLVETVVPEPLAGRKLTDLGLRNVDRVSVVCVKPEGQPFTYTEAETVLGPRDLIVIAGHRDDVEAFAQKYPR